MTRLGSKQLQMHRLPNYLSFSQISALTPEYRYSCGRKFAYRYVLKLPTSNGWSLICGSAFDAGLTWWFRNPMSTNARFVGACAVASLSIAQDLKKNPLDYPATEKDVERRTEMVYKGLAEAVKQFGDAKPARMRRGDNFYACADLITSDGFRRNYARTANLELAIEQMGHVEIAAQKKHVFHVDDIELLGYSDLITEDGVIRDYKWTGMWPRDEQWIREKRDQLALYWIARRIEDMRDYDAKTDRSPEQLYTEAGERVPTPNVAELWILYMRVNMKEPQVHRLRFELTQADEDRALELVRRADATRKEGRFPARPGEACGLCDFAMRCRDDEAAHGVKFQELVGATK